MPKKISSSEESLKSLIDIFEAVKRAMVRRGFIRQKVRPKKPSSTMKAKAPEKLIDAAQKGHDILFKANTIFPFTLFPDTVTLDREKLTLARRFFFLVAKITSIPVRDMLSVDANIGPFFGSVHTSSRFFITNPLSVNFLWRKDALRLQRLLQGYIIVHEQEIDCTHISNEDLITLLLDLGEGDTG